MNRHSTYEHLQTFWGAARRRVRPVGGRSYELPRDFEVAFFPARDRRDRRKYATIGAGTREFFLYVPWDDDERHVELLSAIAHFAQTTTLGAGHTVNFGRAWLLGSLCDYGLLSPPHMEPDDFARCDGCASEYLWVLPITSAERTFKIDHGLEALEQRLEDAGISPDDPNRRSAI